MAPLHAAVRMVFDVPAVGVLDRLSAGSGRETGRGAREVGARLTGGEVTK